MFLYKKSRKTNVNLAKEKTQCVKALISSIYGHMSKGLQTRRSKGGMQEKRWEDNTKKWIGLDITVVRGWPRIVKYGRRF